MAGAYQTGPDLEGFSGLTVRGVAKFGGLIIFMVGADFLARRYGVQRWLFAAAQIPWIAFAAWMMWLSGKTLISGKEVPSEVEGARYSDPDHISFISPRAAALMAVTGAAAILAFAVLRLIQILSE
jgi:hypothetical protein